MPTDKKNRFHNKHQSILYQKVPIICVKAKYIYNYYVENFKNISYQHEIVEQNKKMSKKNLLKKAEP